MFSSCVVHMHHVYISFMSSFTRYPPSLWSFECEWLDTRLQSCRFDTFFFVMNGYLIGVVCMIFDVRYKMLAMKIPNNGELSTESNNRCRLRMIKLWLDFEIGKWVLTHEISASKWMALCVEHCQSIKTLKRTQGMNTCNGFRWSWHYCGQFAGAPRGTRCFARP